MESPSKAIEKALKFLMKENKRIKKEYRSDNILLGRKFQLGSQFQYKLAKELFGDTKEILVLVDSAITYQSQPRNKTRYPDILVIEENILQGIIEVKIDLGHLKLDKYGIEKDIASNLAYVYSKNKNRFMGQEEELFSKDYFTFRDKRDEKNPKKKVKIRDVPKLFLVATKVNDHSRSSYFKNAVKDAGYSSLFVLEKNHPNRPDCSEKKIEQEIKNKRKKIESILAPFF